MKNSKLVLVSALSLFMLASVESSFAQKRGEPGTGREMTERRNQMPGNAMNRIPDLTDDQRTKLKALRTETQKQVLPLENQIGEKEARLKSLTTAEKADMKSIDNLIEEIGDLKVEIAKLRAATHQKVRAELTEDQRLFLDSHMEEDRRNRRRMNRGR
ncbi:MAG: periplasmic heavy metal sensor [Bacteroidota bacterium]